jgi:hypothetical protein
MYPNVKGKSIYMYNVHVDATIGHKKSTENYKGT